MCLSRPETLNAFNETMIAELTETYLALDANPAVRVVLLWSEGKAFSSGADLQWMRRASVASHSENLLDALRFAEMLRVIYECRKPTVARVHGHAFGGGVGLMAACDIVVATPACRFAVSEARFGILPSVIGPYLVNAVGPRQAKRLALTAAQFDPMEAKALGLLHHVVAPENLDDEIDRILADLSGNGPNALAEIKKLFQQLQVGPVEIEVRTLTAQTIARVRATEEAREGFNAFFEKRPAAWKQT